MPTFMMVAVIIPVPFMNVDFFRRTVVVFFIFVVMGPMNTRRWPMIGAGGIMAFAIPWNVDVMIPTIIDKVDRPTAGIVPMTVFIPSLGMGRGHPQVDRGVPGLDAVDDDRLRIEQPWRRKTAEVNAPVESGLADTDRDSCQGLINCHCQETGKDYHDCFELFHSFFLQIQRQNKI